MIKGQKYRGISYKCGVGYYNDEKWAKASNDLETIPGLENDPQVCEMLVKCHINQGNTNRAKKFFDMALNSYKKEGLDDKAERLSDKYKL